MGITIPQTRSEVLPVGEYLAQVASVTEEEGQYGPQLKFTFDLLGDYAGKSLVGWCSRSFNVKSKLYGWTKAIFGGAEIPAEWAFDSDKVLNRKVILIVIKRPGEGDTEFNKIDGLSPYKAKKPAPAPAKKPVVEPEPEADPFEVASDDEA